MQPGDDGSILLRAEGAVPALVSDRTRTQGDGGASLHSTNSTGAVCISIPARAFPIAFTSDETISWTLPNGSSDQTK